MPDPNRWVPAVLVGEVRETATARTLLLDAPELGPALAGQHVDLRLTAEDGYTAQRSYSLSSAAGARPLQITVEEFEDGEVSPYLVEDLAVGDAVELRGPIGGWLVWRPDRDAAPVQLIAGGSGVAPLMAMLRTRRDVGSTREFRLLYGATDPSRVYYRDELAAMEQDGVRVDLHFSRRTAEGGAGHRLTAEDVARLTIPAPRSPEVFVCGPTGFVEAVATALVEQGHPESRVRTERFGPTG